MPASIQRLFPLLQRFIVRTFHQYVLRKKRYRRLSTPWILNRITNKGNVLDIGGIGAGPIQDLTAELLRRGSIVTEVDIEKTSFEHPNLTCIETNILTTDFEPDSFNTILAIHVMQHIGNKWKGKNDIFDNAGDVKCIEQIYKWLKPGGMAFIETPVASQLQTLTWDEATEWTVYTMDHLRRLFHRFIIVDSFLYDGALDSRTRIPDARSAVLMLRKPSRSTQTVAGCLTLGDNARKLITPGHMLHIIQWHDRLLAYLGMVGFDGIYLWHGSDIESLKPLGDRPVVANVRTATTLVADGKVHLFCARKVGSEKKDIFRHQEILHFESIDGLDFHKVNRIASGSAPFIFSHDNRYYLYFHRRTGETHDIMLRSAATLSGLKAASEVRLIRRDRSFSVPSMCSYNDTFLLTCEELIDDHWITVLFTGTAPEGPFTEEREPLMQAPCVYQHRFGSRSILTYSQRSPEGVWELWMREGTVKEAAQ